ncbi:hypothetical protein ABDD95_12635 [Mucilaginibacter sp. PAMB04274]|uniref:hypothetical protein n=1 Tax=Mucilaginibacter sp. PAMB04274 TaxID=3138568 RepID=UPI0031F5F55C
MYFSKKSIFISFGAIAALTSVTIVTAKYLIYTTNFFAESKNPLTGIYGQDALLLSELNIWLFLIANGYLLVKCLLVSFCLYTGFFIAGRVLSFRQIFGVVTLAESAFIISALLKVCWFHWRYPNGSLMEWHSVYMLSIIGFFNHVPAAWSYALQTMNGFELVYILTMAFGISRMTGNTYKNELTVVAASYMPVLLLWVVIVTFCTILYFPDHT